MHRILAFDQSGLTGFCHGVPGDQPDLIVNGTFKVAGSLTAPKRAKNLYRFVRDLIEANEIGEVVLEEPILPKVTSFAAVSSLAGYAMAISWAADDFGIACSMIRMQTWRSEFEVPTAAPRKIKGATERRKWVKDQTIARCRRLGFNPSDDNAADAIGIWSCIANRRLAKERAPTFDIFSDARL